MNNDGHWLNGDRLHGHPRLFIALYGLFCIVWAVLAKDGMDPYSKPISYEFITFWSASRIALDGAPLDAYSPMRLFGMQQAAVPALQMAFLWHHPQTFYLVVLPLSLLPFLWSYISFVPAGNRDKFGTTSAALRASLSTHWRVVLLHLLPLAR